MMSNKKLRLTEKEYQEILNKNQKISISKSKSNIPNKVSLNNSSEKKTKKLTTTYDIIKQNNDSKITTSISEEHFSIIFEGARLLSINQIFAILQSRKYEIFNYKKSWHTIIKKNLEEQYWLLKSQNKTLPFFDSNVEITIFRQAPRLVDEDSLITMFKYIIDAFKKTDKNCYGILAEDNPKIVHKIESYSEKGEYCVGIKIKKINDKEKENYTIEKILKK